MHLAKKFHPKLGTEVCGKYNLEIFLFMIKCQES